MKDLRRYWEYHCPTPHGVGGLKFDKGVPLLSRTKSHPSRGGWIEIRCVRRAVNRWSPSHPSRGGWIEILGVKNEEGEWVVPPLTGWVD